MAQETLEEAAEKYVENFAMSVQSARQIGFKDGAKWQQERSYSEDDLRIAFTEGHDSARMKGSYKSNGTFEEDWNVWFEQFKKKEE